MYIYIYITSQSSSTSIENSGSIGYTGQTNTTLLSTHRTFQSNYRNRNLSPSLFTHSKSIVLRNPSDWISSQLDQTQTVRTVQTIRPVRTIHDISPKEGYYPSQSIASTVLDKTDRVMRKQKKRRSLNEAYVSIPTVYNN